MLLIIYLKNYYTLYNKIDIQIDYFFYSVLNINFLLVKRVTHIENFATGVIALIEFAELAQY